MDAGRLFRRGIDGGITFMDNCWDYNGGSSEVRMGKALRDGYRQKVFLMTKIDGRTKEAAARQIDESLRRLQTDRIDLMQFHEIIRLEDPDRIFSAGSAFEAMTEAKKAGKVRFIGFTGHKDPRIHLKMLGKDHPWDTAQMPINVMDFHYRSFQNQVVPECLKKRVGVIGMKSLGGGSPRGRIPTAAGVSAQECMRYALSLPVATLVAGIDSMEVLKQDVEIARGFKPMPDGEKAALLSRVREEAGDGRHELFKSTQTFDGPHHRRQHNFAL